MSSLSGASSWIVVNTLQLTRYNRNRHKNAVVLSIHITTKESCKSFVTIYNSFHKVRRHLSKLSVHCLRKDNYKAYKTLQVEMITLCHHDIKISLVIPKYDWVLWASYIYIIHIHNGAFTTWRRKTLQWQSSQIWQRQWRGSWISQNLEVDPFPWLISLKWTLNKLDLG